VENLSALEYHDKEWKVYKYHDDVIAKSWVVHKNNYAYLTQTEIFENLMVEFKIGNK
jgi:hypothetical protein